MSQPTTERFPTTPYRPDGGFAMPGLFMLVSALVLAGGVFGFAAHWVRQYFYLIGVFALFIGLGLGAVGVFMVKAGRVRNPWVAGIAGFVGGVAAMTLMHHFDYGTLRKHLADIPQEVRAFAELPAAQRDREMTGATAEQRWDIDELAQLVKVDSFLKYLNYRATLGVSIKKAGHGRGMNLGYYGTWIYWGIELLIVAGITLAMVKSSAAEPFCRPCDKWKEDATLGFFDTDPVTATSAISSGDLATLSAAHPTPVATALKVSIASCPGCPSGGDVDVKLEHIITNAEGKPQTKQLAHVTYPRQAMQQLQQLFNPAVTTTRPPALATAS